MLTYEELKKQLNYDSLTGIFRWNMSRIGVKKGKIAGCKTPEGYIQIRINKNIYLAHRLAWFYVNGYDSEYSIDHIDNNPLHRHHNWISNLREVSKQCNARNSGNRKNNISGVKGVSWDNNRNKWITHIKINNKLKNIGRFKDFDEAVCHRLAAEQCVNWEGCDSCSPAYKYIKNILKVGN
jgi:hypothetical protein